MARFRSIFRNILRKWAQLTDDPVYASDYIPGKLVKLTTATDLEFMPFTGVGLIISTHNVRGGHGFGGYSVYIDVLWSNGDYYKGVAMADLTLITSLSGSVID